MHKIGVLTSGGDAPGMNAAIRSVVRTAIYNGMEVVGIKRGYDGLIDKDFCNMSIASVGSIIHKGGTILKTARSPKFMTEEGRKAAVRNLQEAGIEGIICIGGDGTFAGAAVLDSMGIPVMGIPGTIDNDMGFTDFTIGFDTAVNTVLSAISMIRDTGSSHERTTIIEVMGRDCGDIALNAGLAGGADAILIPELLLSVEEVADKLMAGLARNKTHSIILKAEGVDISTDELKEQLEEKTDLDIRTVVLAYLQRGGSPTARDRLIATLIANRAVELLRDDEASMAIGIQKGDIIEVPIGEAVDITKEADLELLPMIDMLSI